MDGWLSADTSPQPLVTYPLLGLGEHHRNQTSVKMDRNETVNDNTCSIITVMLLLGDAVDDIRLGIGSPSSPSIVNTIPSFSS